MTRAFSFLDAGAPKPANPTSPVEETTEKVLVYHPAYNPPLLFLSLVAFSAPSGNRGVPFTVVLDACKILANNEAGTLHCRGSPDILVAPNDTSLLPPGNYTYHTSNDVIFYPIVLSFRAWDAPESLPPHWVQPQMGVTASFKAAADSDISVAIKRDDDVCAVTGNSTRLQSCHLVPSAESPWWEERGMDGRTKGEDVDSPSNIMTMRADLNAPGMDQGNFVLVPFGSIAVCICINDKIPDFAAEHHLRTVRIPLRINPLNVFVRFAWGIFRSGHTTLQRFARRSGAITIPAQVRKVDSPTTEYEAHGETFDPQDDDKVLIADNESVSASTLDRPSPKRQCTEGDAEPDDGPANPTKLSVYRLTEIDLKAAERFDATLHTRPLTQYEVDAGIYPGFSQVLRRKHEYRREHPEVSAVRAARVAYAWEGEDEQEL
ncbi:hypothetical protein B0H19DRAFT_1095893 [Mycena capillaripes]|nr:hypothetical protein B0H19DRAFT_1095893 [Mycena capillaripes]